jgi:hypothetical protein
MSLDILRRTGGWCVELQQPLKHHTGDITAIEIRPPTADIIIRWTNFEIQSMLALLSRMCGLQEKLLRQLPSPDFDRVMLAFMNVAGPQIKADCESGKRMLATPEEDLPESEKIPPPDQQDPRFPAAEGPVVRLGKKEPQLPSDDVQPMNIAPPTVTEAVR